MSWNDYDEKHGTIRVRNSIIMSKDDNGHRRPVVQDSLKTEGSERTLKLNKNAIAALPKKRIGRYIYCTRDGEPLRPRSVQNMLDSVLQRAGIPHRSTHIFRHTFASKLFLKGHDIKIVSELLGHSNVKVTYNTYVTLIKKQKAQAMESIEDMY